ncbi:hypothetical protein [Moorena sp. SIOASIH]|uniref:hypothetical protein n=1 Tax=Moorena sp. SIOASIH TaxID=2607817 RepID=UPI0025F5A318|nr:hypothetical protein [Moorena sp. SIOASIH]
MAKALSHKGLSSATKTILLIHYTPDSRFPIPDSRFPTPYSRPTTKSHKASIPLPK